MSLKVMQNVVFVTRSYSKSFLGHYWNLYLFPLIFYRFALQRRGIHLRFTSLQKINGVRVSDIVCIDSKCFDANNGRISDRDLEFLSNLRQQCSRLLWFDNYDSAGTTQFEVLPYVDAYLKRQLYKNRELYQKEFYDGRIYTDFYQRHCGIKTVSQRQSSFSTLDIKDEVKLKLSWNFGFSDYHSQNKVERVINAILSLGQPRFYIPNESRNTLLSAQFGTSYSLETVSFQREKLLEFVQSEVAGSLLTDRVPKKEYMMALARSEAVLSPFGWGEICLRDFEAFISGSALIKPDMSHIETWPALFRDGETYLAFPWSPNDWAEKLLPLLEDKKTLRYVAHRGQETYKELWGKEGEEMFCDRFIKDMLQI